MANTEHTFTYTKTLKYEEGWGVSINPIYDEETNSVVSIDVEVFAIFPENIVVVGEIPCIKSPSSDYYVPVDNFKHLDDLPYDDHHDLRTRWFATHEEAQQHCKDTIQRWKHPLPWESFVQL